MHTPRNTDFCFEDIENLRLENRGPKNHFKGSEPKRSSPNVAPRIKSRMASASERKRAPFVDVCELLRIVTNVASAALVLASPESFSSGDKESCQLGEDVASLIGTLEDQMEGLAQASENLPHSGMDTDVRDAVDSVAEVIKALMKIINDRTTVQSSHTNDSPLKPALADVSLRDLELANWRNASHGRVTMARSMVLPSTNSCFENRELERQVDRQGLLQVQSNEALADKVKARFELEIESDQLRLQCAMLEDMVRQVAEQVQQSQREVDKLRLEISTAEQEKDTVVANLHWRVQSRVDMECGLIELRMKISQYEAETRKLQEETTAIQEDIAAKMEQADRLGKDLQTRVLQYERLLGNREEELRTAKRREAEKMIDLTQKEQELAVITEKIEALKLEEERIDRALKIEEEIQQKWDILVEMNKSLLEKEARDSVFKLRSDFIDEQLRKSKDGKNIVSLQSPDVTSILGQIYQKMESLEVCFNSKTELTLSRPFSHPPAPTDEKVQPMTVKTDTSSPFVRPLTSERTEYNFPNSNGRNSLRPFCEMSPKSTRGKDTSRGADETRPVVPAIARFEHATLHKKDFVEDAVSEDEDNMVTFRDQSDSSASKTSYIEHLKRNKMTSSQSKTDQENKVMAERLRVLLNTMLENDLGFMRMIAQLLKIANRIEPFTTNLRKYLNEQVSLQQSIDKLNIQDAVKLRETVLAVLENNSISTSQMLVFMIREFKNQKLS